MNVRPDIALRARFRLQLLGRFALFAVDGDSAPIRLPTRKCAALLAFLATRPSQIAGREEIAALLWGDCTEQLARQSLRQALASMRKTLGDAPIIAADNTTVRLDPAAMRNDMTEFEVLADSADAAGLARAGQLFSGDFLQDLNIDEEGFDAWLNSQRVRVQLAAARVCQTYADRPDLVLDGRQAIATTERLLALDPLREDRQRIALILYARHCGRNEALVRAAAFADLLSQELGVSPEKDTRELVERIRAGEFAPPPTSPVVRLPAALPPSAPWPQIATEVPARAAPAQPSRRLFGYRATPIRLAAIASAAVAVICLAGLALKGAVRAPMSAVVQPSERVTPAERWQTPAYQATSDRRIESFTAVAVLPFTALGENAASVQPTADSLAEDLADTLSRSASLRVISHRTMATYHGQPVDVAKLGAELDVRYVLEGTVQTEGARLRVNAALVDPASRSPVWSTRIERDVDERGAVRDEIVARLARELAIEIPTLEAKHESANPTVNKLISRGWAAIYASGRSTSALRDAETAFSQALALDAESTPAKVGLGLFHALAAVNGLDSDFATHVAEAEKILLPIKQGGSFALALIHHIRGDFPKAIESYRHLLENNPSHAPSYAGIGYVLVSSGKPGEGLEYIHYAMRLSPRDAQFPHWLRFAAEAELEQKHYDEALNDARQAEALSPQDLPTLKAMAVMLAAAGRVEEARRYIATLKKQYPDATTERLVKRAVTFASGQPEYLRVLRLALAPTTDSW